MKSPSLVSSPLTYISMCPVQHVPCDPVRIGIQRALVLLVKTRESLPDSWFVTRWAQFWCQVLLNNFSSLDKNVDKLLCTERCMRMAFDGKGGQCVSHQTLACVHVWRSRDVSRVACQNAGFVFIRACKIHAASFSLKMPSRFQGKTPRFQGKTPSVSEM